MFEQFTEQAMAILSIALSGVSVGTVLSLTIYTIRTIVKGRKEVRLNKTQVEEAFKSAILPTNIKLDISKKIETPIKLGLASISTLMDERLNNLEEGNKLMMSILAQFTHTQKLPKEVQEAIKEFLDSGITEHIEL